MTARTLLAILPSSEPTHRVAVMLVEHGLELQHQSWGEGVGWYAQSTVPLDETQATQLRNTLGLAATMDRPTQPKDNPHGLRICAESA